MKYAPIFIPLILATLGSCAILFSGQKSNGNVSIALAEFPAENIDVLQSNFSLDKVDQKKNKIQLKQAALDELVKSFISTAVLNEDIYRFDFYFDQSLPRLRYWEYIVNQLPEYVDYGYKYDAYSSQADEKGQMLAFLSYRLDRNPKNILALFTQSKETIFQIITKKKYEEYRLDEYVNTLMDSYDHLYALPDYDAQMKRIYAEVMEEDKLEDIFGRTSHQYPIYEPIINANIESKYFGTNGMVLNEFGEYTDVLWFHSFWVRRYHEGNSDVVLGILKEIQKHYSEIK